MTNNALALAATIVLIVVGVWLADKIAELRHNQDCYLSGRLNCTPINVPPMQRN